MLRSERSVSAQKSGKGGDGGPCRPEDPLSPWAQILPGPPDTSPWAGTQSRDTLWLHCHLVAALSLKHRVKLAGLELGRKAACWEVTPVSEPLAPFHIS